MGRGNNVDLLVRNEIGDDGWGSGNAMAPTGGIGSCKMAGSGSNPVRETVRHNSGANGSGCVSSNESNSASGRENVDASPPSRLRDLGSDSDGWCAADWQGEVSGYDDGDWPGVSGYDDGDWPGAVSGYDDGDWPGAVSGYDDGDWPDAVSGYDDGDWREEGSGCDCGIQPAKSGRLGDEGVEGKLGTIRGAR
ncbi:hypothetical protein BWQ96_08576 [Gracilariopsis chorda]|uniref:Uncharacterized protein n=1 Tax=Gracilariopsis chorda TaxID=448386 RepID=A0A2V3IHZ5_9FLOR|nr:hypothetical protein BWQ96_08576 [Gracilariopsis chorda]|eukprot:PXF41691.1 hypothetical protein BWQ96_08576 [Gracilariopsis chorda]